MEFPGVNEFGEYNDSVIYECSEKSRKLYEDVLIKYKTPKDFLNKDEYKRSEHKVVIFLCLKLGVRPKCNLQSLIITNSPKLVQYYKLIPEEFISTYKDMIGISPEQETRFCSQIIKALIYLNKERLECITYRDTIKLKDKDFNTITPQKISFLSKFQKLVMMINPDSRRCEFPPIEELEDYIKNVFHGDKPLENVRVLYRKIIMNFNTPEEFLKQKNFIYRENVFVIFLCLKQHIKPQYNIQEVRINNYREIINYFNLVPSEFWEGYEKEVKGLDRRKSKFLVQIIKALIFLRKTNVNEITYEDILRLRDKNFFTGVANNERFPTILEKVLGIMNRQALPYKLPQYIELDYGTKCEKTKEVIKEYLQKKYINKNYKTEMPLIYIRQFFKWVSKNYHGILGLDEINEAHWLEYKEYVIMNNKYKERTKEVKISLVAMFFEWTQRENIINTRIVDINERYIRKEDCKPRMFKEREYSKLILQQILLFEPSSDQELLFKMYMLIASATGLRKEEVLWLEPNCLYNSTYESAEISLQVVDKIGVKNKITSVLPWGIEPLKYLIKRFENLEIKIKFYNERLGKHVYSLFQYDNKLLSRTYIYEKFSDILSKANILDDCGELVEFADVKIHGFRHQKFNDIYEITNGSIAAVKVDSGHRSSEMARRYTKQNQDKRQLQALRLIEEGMIVGKGAEIIKEMLKTPYSIERYIEIVKKMTQDIQRNDVTKFLGFGFCFSKKCEIVGGCERCDFFYTCETYLEELADRYSKNFAILKSKLGRDWENTILEECNSQLIIELKYQEKWLSELGMTDEEISKLRTKLLREESDGESKFVY
ncbi:hypothetical protein JHL18_13615 [Clostridium sp. YIM B02505]|uniref:Core-binding (CB) domain-containing protein n=1 Tax=Clostridium yunnanense TaxID=2800325 RepID=A0ABS1EQI0_9CLOT|nr:hypothetical protein [Clostridium yunnanense]MBK1811656.1 hypothetical protein [Clostridium yunnanense]